VSARSSAATGQAPDLGRPPWVAAAAFAAVATALVCYPAWPGFMSFDSLLAFRQSISGIETATWPPLHAYLFWLSRTAHTGTGGLYAFQAFVLLFGAVLALRMLVPSRPLGWTLAVFFVGGLAYFPTLLGTLLVHWRDVPTAGFTILGLAFWLAAVQRRSAILLALTLLSIGLAVALRYNAIVLVAPLLALMVWRPFLDRGAGAGVRVLAALLIVVSLGLGWASTKWRLPDGAPLTAASGFAGAELFDLIGVSACSGQNYLPAAVTEGAPVSIDQIRRAYDPRHLHLTLAPKPGVPQLFETTAAGQVTATWRHVLRSEPRCYIAHRSAVFVEQMGMANQGVYYTTHGQIDPNPYGLRLSRPAAAEWVAAYVTRNANEPWRRPYLLYLGAAALALAASLRDRRLALLLAALVTGAFTYAAVLFVAAPAADARYIFPSNALCLLVALLSLGVLASPGRSR